MALIAQASAGRRIAVDMGAGVGTVLRHSGQGSKSQQKVFGTWAGSDRNYSLRRHYTLSGGLQYSTDNRPSGKTPASVRFVVLENHYVQWLHFLSVLKTQCNGIPSELMRISGVDFPEQLLASRRKSELVIFAGAGVSIPAPSNFPNFKTLAEQIAPGVLTL